MGDYNVSLGRGKKAEQINPNELKGGITKEEAGDEFASIFDALDKGGQTKGVLEQSEVENIKNAINTAKGKNQKLSKHETKGLLEKLGLKGVKVETFFNFLKKIIGLSANVESSITDNDGNTTVLHKADDNGNHYEVTKNKNGEVVKEVQYQNKGKENETYQIRQNGQIIGGKDSYGEYTQKAIENGYIITYKDGVTKTFKNGEEVGGKAKDGKKYTMRNEKGTDRCIEYDQVQVFEGSKDKRYYKNGEWVGGTDGFKSYTIKKNGNTLTQTFGDGQIYTEQYDEQGRLVERKRGDGFIYEHREYDTEGGYTLTDSNNNIVKYNKLGQMIEKMYPDGDVLTHQYDNKGREICVTKNGKKYSETMYNADGSYKTIYYKKDQKTSEVEYNKYGNITKQTEDGSTSTWTYTYDNQGRITSEVDNNGFKTTYEDKEDGGEIQKRYDSEGNLEEETEYDAHGNIIREKTANCESKTVYTYDDQGRILTTNYGNNDTETYENIYTYNNDGSYSITYKVGGEQTEIEHYDQYGKMLDKQETGGEKFEYKYDNQGRFLAKETSTDDGTKKYFSEFSDTTSVIKNSDGSFTTTAKSGENFNQTMERLGIKKDNFDNDEKYNKAVELFTEANKAASKRSKGGWFKVGEMDVNIPKELAEMLDFENNINNDVVLNREDEVDNWKTSRNR